MTLREFLETLNPSNNVTVTVVEGTTEIITFKASGYASLDDALEEREVQEWSVTGPLTAKVILKPIPVTTEP